ncbi:MAG: hypothetical protein ACKVS6_12690 [Planctomycetota bacterium]
MVNSTLQIDTDAAVIPRASVHTITPPDKQASWKPTDDPALTFATTSHEFAVGDAYGTAAYAENERDPMRVGAVWVSILVVATAAYSLIFGSTI